MQAKQSAEGRVFAGVAVTHQPGPGHPELHSLRTHRAGAVATADVGAVAPGIRDRSPSLEQAIAPLRDPTDELIETCKVLLAVNIALPGYGSLSASPAAMPMYSRLGESFPIHHSVGCKYVKLRYVMLTKYTCSRTTKLTCCGPA